MWIKNNQIRSKSYIACIITSKPQEAHILLSIIYRTSLDILAKGITMDVTLLFATIIFGKSLVFNDGNNTVAYFLTIFLVLIYLFTFAFSPINYKLITAKLIIHRLLSDVEIYTDEIKSIYQLRKQN